MTMFQLEFVSNGSKLLSGDGGGILKIWDVNSGICDKTLEGHDDKVWDIVQVSSSSDSAGLPELVTVGADGKIQVWRDISEEIKVIESKKASERLAQTQALTNFLEQHRYSEALIYAINLNQPLKYVSPSFL